jgi:hypothetical protein
MKLDLEPNDIELIARRVVELLLPHLPAATAADDPIFDTKALSEYMKMSVQ